jgi:hypothetical protein
MTQNTYICPNTEICPIYKVKKGKYSGQEKEGKIDCIVNNGERYFCEVLSNFRDLDNLSKLTRFSKFVPNETKSECALIELLNNSKALPDLGSK